MSNLPPVHPILVNFTAALVPVSLVSDLLGRILRRESLLAVGWWTLLYATVITPFTALAGRLWLQSMGEMDHPEMAIHRWLGTVLAALLVPLVLWRGRLYRRELAPSVVYLSACTLVFAGLVYQAKLGGAMSFEAEESPNTAHTHSYRAGANGGPEEVLSVSDGELPIFSEAGHCTVGTTPSKAGYSATGSVNKNVDPWPRVDSTQIRPPRPSTMR